MNVIKRLATSLLLLLIIHTAPILAQQKRQTPARPQPKAAAPAPTPAPTFDNLLPADSYVVYAEVRDAGQLIHSSTLNDVLDPILKLAGPPKEFKSVVKWINAHADQMMSSRLFVAAWPTIKNIPDILVVIEFASPEEATKFATPLNEFLPTILPNEQPAQAAKNAPPKPGFHLERLGSLIAISARPWTMKQMRPAGSKSLADEANFRTARNRFSSEPLFAYVNLKLIEKEEEERRKQIEEMQRKAAEEQAKRDQVKEKQESEETATDPPPEFVKSTPSVVFSATVDPPKEAPTPDPMSSALSTLGSRFFGGNTNLPDGLGLALSYEGESFDLRALLINAAGEKVDVIPFWPNIIAGAPIAPQSPNILPAGTELFITMSLDLPQIYSEMSKPPKTESITYRNKVLTPSEEESESPFKPLEDKLQLNVKDEVLPLLGNEIAFGLPMNAMQIPGLLFGPMPAPKTEEPDKQAPAKDGPIIVIAVRDKERLRALMPKLIEGLGFKGASQFAQTERREDTELVSYVNLFAYAFVGDFLVLSTDAATTRHVVDSYLKNETLATEINFKTHTRWQPRQLQGEIYVSPALMKTYIDFYNQPTRRVSEQARSFMMRLSTVAEPITYSLSNEGLGPVHELHIPKNLVAIAVTGISGAINPPQLFQSESAAIGLAYSIAFAEEKYKAKQGDGSYGTLEDLIAAELVSKEMLENSAYKFELTAGGDRFELSAVPSEYGKSGHLSLFIDQTRVMRGGDRNGAAATASDPPLSY
jgi:hypothetical protein